MHVICVGNPSDGFNYYIVNGGLCDDPDYAGVVADDEFGTGPESWWVLETTNVPDMDIPERPEAVHGSKPGNWMAVVGDVCDGFRHCVHNGRPFPSREAASWAMVEMKGRYDSYLTGGESWQLVELGNIQIED